MLVYTYAFMAPLGTLAKLSDDHRSLGFSTLCMLLLILVRFPNALRLMMSQKLLLWVSVLLVYCLGSTLSRTGTPYPEELYNAYKNLLSLMIYTTFAASVASLNWTMPRLFMVARWLAIGMCISAGLTLVDHLGWVDIPRVNESHVVTVMDEGESVSQAHGPFNHRTSLAIYMALTISFFLTIRLSCPSPFTRSILWLASGLSLMVLLLSHNRAAPVAIGLSCGLFYVRNGLKLPILLIKTAIAVVPVMIVIEVFLPRIAEVYRTMLGMSPLAFLLPNNTVHNHNAVMEFHDSDTMRFELFKDVLRTIGESPLGTGFGNVYTLNYGWFDPHSLITAVFLASGIFAVPWLIGFAMNYIAMLRNAGSRVSDKMGMGALNTSLLALFLVGIMHNVLYIGIAWMFLGLLVSLDHGEMKRQFVRRQRRSLA